MSNVRRAPEINGTVKTTQNWHEPSRAHPNQPTRDQAFSRKLFPAVRLSSTPRSRGRAGQRAATYPRVRRGNDLLRESALVQLVGRTLGCDVGGGQVGRGPTRMVQAVVDAGQLLTGRGGERVDATQLAGTTDEHDRLVSLHWFESPAR